MGVDERPATVAQKLKHQQPFLTASPNEAEQLRQQQLQASRVARLTAMRQQERARAAMQNEKFRAHIAQKVRVRDEDAQKTVRARQHAELGALRTSLSAALANVGSAQHGADVNAEELAARRATSAAVAGVRQRDAQLRFDGAYDTAVVAPRAASAARDAERAGARELAKRMETARARQAADSGRAEQARLAEEERYVRSRPPVERVYSHGCGVDYYKNTFVHGIARAQYSVEREVPRDGGAAHPENGRAAAAAELQRLAEVREAAQARERGRQAAISRRTTAAATRARTTRVCREVEAELEAAARKDRREKVARAYTTVARHETTAVEVQKQSQLEKQFERMAGVPPRGRNATAAEAAAAVPDAEVVGAQMEDGAVVMWQNPGIRGLPRRVVALDTGMAAPASATVVRKIPTARTAARSETVDAGDGIEQYAHHHLSEPSDAGDAVALFRELAEFAGLDTAAADAIAALAEAEAAVVPSPQPPTPLSVAVDGYDDEPSRISQALSGTSLSSELDGGSRPDFSTLSSIESLTLSRSST